MGGKKSDDSVQVLCCNCDRDNNKEEDDCCCFWFFPSVLLLVLLQRNATWNSRPETECPHTVGNASEGSELLVFVFQPTSHSPSFLCFFGLPHFTDCIQTRSVKSQHTHTHTHTNTHKERERERQTECVSFPQSLQHYLSAFVPFCVVFLCLTTTPKCRPTNTHINQR